MSLTEILGTSNTPSVTGLQYWIHFTHEIRQNCVWADSDGVLKLPLPSLCVESTTRAVPVLPAPLLRSVVLLGLASEAGGSQYLMTLLQKHLPKSEYTACNVEDVEESHYSAKILQTALLSGCERSLPGDLNLQRLP